MLISCNRAVPRDGPLRPNIGVDVFKHYCNSNRMCICWFLPYQPFTMFIHTVRSGLDALCTVILPLLHLSGQCHFLPILAPPTTATLKLPCLRSIESFPAVVGLYYSTAQSWYMCSVAALPLHEPQTET